MKRLLSIATLYPNAHSPRFGTFVARQLEALATLDDWEVTVINPIGIPGIAAGRYRPLAAACVSGQENGVEVHRPRFTLIPAVGGRFNPALIARAVLPLARTLHNKQPFDLIDAQFFYPDGPVAARIAAELGLPLSIKARGADISHWGQKPYAQKMMRVAANQASGLLAVSKALAADMGEIGLPQGKITVHYTGLDRTLFRPMDRTECRARLAAELGLAIAPDAILLATVGALIPRKGQELVVRALASLPDAQLALVGLGPDRVSLAALAQSEGVAERVHFLGSLSHEMLPVVLNSANIMVLPSASEGLANAWVEALACGTPLVISDAGGAQELVSSESAGRIVERNVQAIVEGVTEVLALPFSPSQVAESVAQFSWQNNAAALADFYAGLIRNP